MASYMGRNGAGAGVLCLHQVPVASRFGIALQCFLGDEVGVAVRLTVFGPEKLDKIGILGELAGLGDLKPLGE